MAKRNEQPAAPAEQSPGAPEVSLAAGIPETDSGSTDPIPPPSAVPGMVDFNSYDPAQAATGDVQDALFQQLPDAVPVAGGGLLSQEYRFEGGGEPYPMFDTPFKERI